MKIEQFRWNETDESLVIPPAAALRPYAQLVLVFFDRPMKKLAAALNAIQEAYPRACLMGCSTAGEICGREVTDRALVATAIYLEHSNIVCAGIDVHHCSGSYDVGRQLAGAFDPEGLRHLFVLSDGLLVNGSELVKGMTEVLPRQVSVTGGLAGDRSAFQETLVVDRGAAASGRVTACGFYGSRLRVGYGTRAGWDPFGIDREITRSSGNVLYELDRKSALALYKTYLGERANELPASGLYFPLELKERNHETSVVRTVLAVDEKEQSMTFAGDVPEGAYARFMKANHDRLIDGAVSAAGSARKCLGGGRAQLALLISCVGRKMVLGQRVEEEVEGVADLLGNAVSLTGFYSYGELCPFSEGTVCELHNQTMTITTLGEE